MALHKHMYTVLRNAHEVGYVLPDRDGLGVATRQHDHHVRVFVSKKQINDVVRWGYLQPAGVTPDEWALPIYTLTDLGHGAIPEIPKLKTQERFRGSTCSQCGQYAVLDKAEDEKMYWCYFCEVHTPEHD